MPEIMKEKFLDMLWRTRVPGETISLHASSSSEYQRIRHWVRTYNDKYHAGAFHFKRQDRTITITRVKSDLGELDAPVGWTRNPNHKK